MQKTSTAGYTYLHDPTVHSGEMLSSLYMIQKPGGNKWERSSPAENHRFVSQWGSQVDHSSIKKLRVTTEWALIFACRLQVHSTAANLNHKILDLLTKWRCPAHTQSYHRLFTDAKSSFSFSKICFTKVIKRWVRWYSKMLSIGYRAGCILAPRRPRRLTVEVLDSEGAEE